MFLIFDHIYDLLYNEFSLNLDASTHFIKFIIELEPHGIIWMCTGLTAEPLTVSCCCLCCEKGKGDNGDQLIYG